MGDLVSVDRHPRAAYTCRKRQSPTESQRGHAVTVLQYAMKITRAFFFVVQHYRRPGLCDVPKTISDVLCALYSRTNPEAAETRQQASVVDEVNKTLGLTTVNKSNGATMKRT